jgi:VanZ family protein
VNKSPTVYFTRTLWLLFALFVVYGGTIPFRFTADLGFVVDKLSRVSLNILISPETGRRVSIADVVQNILLFVPFGILGLWATATTGRVPVKRIFVVTALGALLATGVEILQLFTWDRIASLTDIVADSAGALLGAVAAYAGGRVAIESLRTLTARGLVAAPAPFYRLLIIGIGACVAAWEPFDVSLDIGAIAQRVQALRLDPWQFVAFDDEGVALIQYALLAVAAAAWMRSIGSSRAARQAAMGVAIVAVCLEGSQLVISSRMPGLEDMLTRVVGGLIGVWFWIEAPRYSSRLWVSLLVAATAAAATMQMLSPFTFASHFLEFQWVVLFSNYANTTFDALSETVELILIYLPLGYAIAVISANRRRAFTFAAMATLAIAGPLEYLQGWVIGRHADVTDVIISVMGSGLGTWLATTGASVFSDYVATAGSLRTRGVDAPLIPAKGPA